ncbi:MAG: hypothetical protein WCL46_09205 [Chlorobium sp.]
MADIRIIGGVTEDVSPARIVEARKNHCELLTFDLVHFKDLPARP